MFDGRPIGFHQDISTSEGSPSLGLIFGVPPSYFLGPNKMFYYYRALPLQLTVYTVATDSRDIQRKRVGGSENAYSERTWLKQFEGVRFMLRKEIIIERFSSYRSLRDQWMSWPSFVSGMPPSNLARDAWMLWNRDWWWFCRSLVLKVM